MSVGTLSRQDPIPQPNVEGGFAALDSGILVPRVRLPQIAGLLHKLDGTTNPGVGDDSADGYGVGSLWVDTTNDAAYVCLDSTVGAAVWREIGVRSVRGRVAANGSILTGTGFSVVRNGAGDYTITYTVPFLASPVVNATLGEFTSGRESIATRAPGGGTPDTTNVQVIIGIVGVSLSDQIFSFIAVGY